MRVEGDVFGPVAHYGPMPDPPHGDDARSAVDGKPAALLSTAKRFIFMISKQKSKPSFRKQEIYESQSRDSDYSCHAFIS